MPIRIRIEDFPKNSFRSTQLQHVSHHTNSNSKFHSYISVRLFCVDWQSVVMNLISLFILALRVLRTAFGSIIYISLVCIMSFCIICIINRCLLFYIVFYCSCCIRAYLTDDGDRWRKHLKSDRDRQTVSSGPGANHDFEGGKKKIVRPCWRAVNTDCEPVNMGSVYDPQLHTMPLPMSVEVMTLRTLAMHKKLSYRRGTARRVVSVATARNVVRMFDKWPSGSSKVIGNGTNRHAIWSISEAWWC